MKTFSAACLLILSIHFASPARAQQLDTAKSRSAARPYMADAMKIIATGLETCQADKFLYALTTIGPRLSGSPNAARAVDWSKGLMDTLGFENVHAESVMVPHWVRGKTERALIRASKFNMATSLKICALGGSIGTPANGITAHVLEVQSFDKLHALAGKAKGKIIFFNRPMDPTLVNTFEAYGGAVDQRWGGAMEAARAGGVAALVRSMSTRIDNVPHTGSMGYNDSIPKVPAAAISTLGAGTLSDLLKKDTALALTLMFDAQTLPDTLSYNVMGELRGSEHPEQIIVIGGHLDSWDKGRGAHDDGAGIVQSIEALRLLKLLNLTPKRTIRAVMFMNEENGSRGGKAYAARTRPGEKHIAAIESDEGGFAPRGFGVSSPDSTVYDRVARWSYLFEPINAARIVKGGGGVDISPLGKQGVPLIGLNPENQRYFDYHHSDSDTFDKVNERELELGAEAMAILAYVLAQEGL